MMMSVRPVQSNFIGEYQVSEKSVEQLIDHWSINKDNADFGRVGFGYDESRKKSLEYIISPEELPNFDYHNELMKCVHQYMEEYEWSANVAPFGVFENTKIQYYREGWGYYDWHSENQGYRQTQRRHLVFMTYLNSVSDGGGTEFLYQKYITPAEKGKTVIWPSAWTHTHRGVVSPSQEKYIITGWLSFNE